MLEKRCSKTGADICLAIGLVAIVAGAWGIHLNRTGAGVPAVLLIRLIRACGIPALIGGCLLTTLALFMGTVVLNRRFAARDFMPYLLVAPAIAFMLVFVIYPMFNLIEISLFRGTAANEYKLWCGLRNYVALFSAKKDFILALRNTAVYTLAIVVLLISFSVLFAVWMSSERRINHFAQVAVYTPDLVASVSCAFIWSWLCNPESYGMFNTVLRLFGASPVKWLQNSGTAMGCIIAMNTWKNIGYFALIVLSALKTIPLEIYEAAKLDNASPVKCFFRITLPMLSPQLFMLLITITTGSFQVFDSVRVMTNGGPGRSTMVLCMYIYEYAFENYNSLGQGAAAGVVLMLILIFVTLLDFRGIERKIHYQ